jgi:hypothetical protein
MPRRLTAMSPRMKLPELSGALWKAYAAGQVTEEEASQLSDLIEARKVISAPEKPVQRRVGSRPVPLPRWLAVAPGPPQADPGP